MVTTQAFLQRDPCDWGPNKSPGVATSNVHRTCAAVLSPDQTSQHLGKKSFFQASSKVSLVLGGKVWHPHNSRNAPQWWLPSYPPEWAATLGFSSTTNTAELTVRQKHEASQRGKQQLPPLQTWSAWGGSPTSDVTILQDLGPRLLTSVCVWSWAAQCLDSQGSPARDTQMATSLQRRKSLAPLSWKTPCPTFPTGDTCVFTWKTTVHGHGHETWRREMCIWKQRVGSGLVAMLLLGKT